MTPSAPVPQPSPSITSSPSLLAMYRSLGLLYLCGGSVAWLWTWLTAYPTGEGLVRVMASLAMGGGLTLALVAPRCRRRWPLHVVLAVIQLVIAVGYLGLPDPDNDGRWFWAWATPYAAFFFSRRWAALHTGWVAVVAGSALLAGDATPRAAAALWLLTMATVAAVAVLVSWAAAALRRSESRLAHLALHDPLTGLPNRRLYAARTEEELSRARHRAGSVAVALVDLDDFKLVNDTYGHETGDEMLIDLARRLSRREIGADLVVRLGGDEFVLLFTSARGALDLDDVGRRVASAWTEPFELRDGTLWSGGSVGLAVAQPPDLPAASATSLLREADAALYRAKSTGTCSHAVYDTAMRDAAAGRLRLDAALRAGLEEQQLRLHFQPVLDLQEHRWHGAEALLRWQHPEQGLVAPEAFVPLAEETRLIVPIGDWVLRRSVEQLRDWRARAVVDDAFVMSVNVSPRQLRTELPQRVAEALAEHGVPGRCLAFELTETVLLTDSAETVRVLEALRGLGVLLHLDDFGTGHSSLAHLDRVPADLVKIDRSLVAGLPSSPQRTALVSAVVALGTALAVPVAAEGVESSAQEDALREAGCRFGQGFRYAPPQDAAATEEVLRGPVPLGLSARC